MFDFFISQVLGMQWLNNLIWQILQHYLQADPSSPIWGSIHFFLYDTIKITLLLVTLIFLFPIFNPIFPRKKPNAYLHTIQVLPVMLPLLF